MGILMAFAVGYVVGARAGEAGFREVVDALKAVRDSDEFAAFVAALRAHLGHTFGDLAARLGDDGAPLTMDDVVARVRQLVNERAATSNAS